MNIRLDKNMIIWGKLGIVWKGQSRNSEGGDDASSLKPK